MKIDGDVQPDMSVRNYGGLGLVAPGADRASSGLTRCGKLCEVANHEWNVRSTPQWIEPWWPNIKLHRAEADHHTNVNLLLHLHTFNPAAKVLTCIHVVYCSLLQLRGELFQVLRQELIPTSERY